MIGNVTTGKDFRGLARYLTRRSERVAWTGTRNTVAEDARGAAEEMELMSERSTCCKKPVYHLSLSWPAEDAPTRRDSMRRSCRTERSGRLVARERGRLWNRYAIAQESA